MEFDQQKFEKDSAIVKVVRDGILKEVTEAFNDGWIEGYLRVALNNRSHHNLQDPVMGLLWKTQDEIIDTTFYLYSNGLLKRNQ